MVRVASSLRQLNSSQRNVLAFASALLPSRRGGRLSSDAVQRLVATHAAAATRTRPSLQAKKVTPHTLRHTAAMSLLHAGVDISVIALWLGCAARHSCRIARAAGRDGRRYLWI
jgi:site-specific recombinase XerD